ncbi:MAG: response regulator [Planctomycetota bacterium]|nr:response regulator [Planctomycetota bacterium]
MPKPLLYPARAPAREATRPSSALRAFWRGAERRAGLAPTLRRTEVSGALALERAPEPRRAMPSGRREPARPSESIRERRVLLVEADEWNRRVLTSLLARRGLSVRLAPDPSSARRLLAERPIVDLVLARLELPWARGTDWLGRLHEDAPDTPIFVLASYLCGRAIDTCCREGITYCLPLPLSEEILDVALIFALEDLSPEARARVLARLDELTE